eukprot:7855814-Pyramimonas_sp.AAC.1
MPLQVVREACARWLGKNLGAGKMGCKASRPQSVGQDQSADKGPLPKMLPAILVTVLEDSPYPVCAFDINALDQPIVYVNDVFLEKMEYKRSELLHTDGKLLQGSDTDASTVIYIQECIREGKTFMGRLLNYTKSGKPLWNYMLLLPLRNEKGSLTHYTSLSILVNKDDFQHATFSATELSQVADHIERQGGVPMLRLKASELLANAPQEPKAPTRASMDGAHRQGGRRASVLAGDLRKRLDSMLSEHNIQMAIINTCDGSNDYPLMYVSQHLIGETFMREIDLIGANLTFLIGKPTTLEEKESYQVGRGRISMWSGKMTGNARHPRDSDSATTTQRDMHA